MSGKIRIAVMSDLHVEFDRWGTQEGGAPQDGHPVLGPDLRALKAARPDIVVLAGDIDMESPIAYANQVARYLGVPVVLVAGNHDFYRHEHPRRIEDLRRKSAACRDVVFLENGVFETEIRGKRLRLLGCTLWTDYALFGDWTVEDAMRAAAFGLNDHRVIFTGQGRGLEDDTFRPADALRLHEESVSWLRAELAKPWDGTTVVITHHALSMKSVAERFRTGMLSAAFSSALDDLVIGSGAALWAHGHTHDSFDYCLGGTRVICNPRGYSGRAENPDFRADMILEV